jgi:UDP-2-acetamido-2-deoxy-ribo-hexuluronate aminotransferase
LGEAIAFVDLKRQYAEQRAEIDRRMQAVLEHGQYIMGPEVAELEERLSKYVGAECITVASGTEALLIALMALGIGRGDEVITSPFTFAATAEVIALVGAVPVFVDVEPDTANLDVHLVEEAITERTRAIMPVSLYGQPCDMAGLNAIGARHGLAVIEDAAQSFGALYEDRRSGGLSTIGCTSFFPSKPLGCYGDGGAMFTRDVAIAKTARQIRIHGQDRRYHHVRVGVGGRLDTLQAAVLLAKLERFDWEIEQRLVVGQRYLEMLAGLNTVQLPVVRPGRTCVWAQFTVQVDRRDAVVTALNAAGIPTAIHYPLPLHQQPAYRDLCRVSRGLPEAERLGDRVLSLPMHPYLDQSIQARVVAALKTAVAQ